MANTSILAAFERMWQHTTAALGEKSNTDHTHDDRYYTESEVDTKISAINTVVTNITNGTTKVPKAAYADTANTATQASKATSDKSGNVITSTYATKSELSTVSNLVGDTAVSTQISTAIANKADSVHNHTTLDGVQEIRNASGTIQVNSDKLNLFANSVVLKNNPYDDFDAATKYYVDTSISSHNSNASAHADIRNQISQLSSDIAAINRDGIIQEVIAALQTPVFGYVDENNNIILTGELVDGTYTIKYEDAEGNQTLIGTLSSEAPVLYTNQIPISTDTDGSVYNGTGYMAERRFNSSCNVATLSVSGATNPIFVTGFIPVKSGDVVRLKNCFIDTNQVENGSIYGQNGWSINNVFYDSVKGQIGLQTWTATATGGTYTTGTTDASGHVTEFTVIKSTAAYMRLCLAATGSPADAIVTVNEEII